MNLDDIIRYEEENTNLDFKKEEYRKGNYSSLIKDVMSMANVLNTEKKRIIIGIKHEPGKDRIFEGIDRISDQAIFENIIQENIEPNVNFRYYAHEFEGKKLGILEISDNIKAPYMMKKDYSTDLKIGDAWIRKGSRQSKFKREDIENVFSIGKKAVFENKVKIVCGKDLSQEINLSKASINKESFLSAVRKERLIILLDKINNRYKKMPEKNKNMDASLEKSIIKLTGSWVFSEFKDTEKSIRVGYDNSSFPVYYNREQLFEEIDKLSSISQDEDFYYIYEENSHKINFYIFNDGTEFLEDVVIDLYFDSEVFSVAKKIYKKPKSIDYQNLGFDDLYKGKGYPSVYKEDNNFIVKEEHEKIRHKRLTKTFFAELRVLIR